MNAARAMNELSVAKRHKPILESLKKKWCKEVQNGWNPTLQEYNTLLSHISARRGRDWLAWGDQVFKSCIIRHKADQTTLMTYFDLLTRRDCSRGDAIQQVIKDYEIQVTPQILTSLIKGYLLDNNYLQAIELFEDYYYKSGFLTKEFYEELIFNLARSEKGSNYALRELYYKILKSEPDIKLTDQMQKGFVKCCKTLHSTEMLYLITENKNLEI